MESLQVLKRDAFFEYLARYLLVIGVILAAFAAFNVAFGSSTSTFSQTIAAGTLSVDIVDANGTTVSSPSVSFPSYTSSFSVGTSTATFGTSSERVRVSNPTATAVWSLSFAPTGTQAIWYSGASNYGYKSADHSTGTMKVDPSVGTLAGVNSCATTNVSLGSATYFSPTTQSITLASAASGAATFCQWDLTGVSVKQEIPASQSSGTYNLGMTVTVS